MGMRGWSIGHVNGGVIAVLVGCIRRKFSEVLLGLDSGNP
jgi:hypothetical protein